MPFDGITIGIVLILFYIINLGNHELNGQESIENIAQNVAPFLGDRYISGHVFLTISFISLLGSLC
jgi:hypothetical protein